MTITQTGSNPLPTLKVGDRVVRGPHWKYGGQDCLGLSEKHLQTAGTVQEIYREGCLNPRVLWDSGYSNTYQYDMERQEVIPFPFEVQTRTWRSEEKTKKSPALDSLLNESREELQRRLLDL